MQKPHRNETIGQGATTAKPTDADTEQTIKATVHDKMEKAGQVASEARASLSDAASDLGSSVAKHAEKASEDVLNKAMDGARATAEQGKNRTQEMVYSLSRALEAGSKSLEDDGMSGTAGYVRAAGKGLEKAASEVDGLDPDNLTRRLETFVRERPVVTVGILAVAGFALASTLKSTRRHPVRDS
ncbi:MAG: hypothetical protein P1V21_06580 [Rhizobiaceae bacterium]|nr:hypothetical protein [Rhizobiaceae bacterium]